MEVEVSDRMLVQRRAVLHPREDTTKLTRSSNSAVGKLLMIIKTDMPTMAMEEATETTMELNDIKAIMYLAREEEAQCLRMQKKVALYLVPELLTEPGEVHIRRVEAWDQDLVVACHHEVVLLERDLVNIPKEIMAVSFCTARKILRIENICTDASTFPLPFIQAEDLLRIIQRPDIMAMTRNDSWLAKCQLWT